MSRAAAIGDRLDAAPAVRAARAAIGGADRVWIVGGAVRDAAARRPVTDLDLAVAEGAGEAARAIAAELGGHSFALSEEFATWRIVAPRAGFHVDVAPLRGAGIESDLELRDFTVNAIATPLSPGGAEEGALVDPHHGLADLDAGVLRAVSERSFADDPLRIARAARLASELDLELDPATLELARASAPRAAEPAGERTYAELRRLLGGPTVRRGIELLEETWATRELLPELEELRGVEQTAYHDVDAHDHTLDVVERVAELRDDLAAQLDQELASGVGNALADPLADEMSGGEALGFAALLHDVGKSRTRAITDDGRVTFFGHDRVGAEMVRTICARLRTSRRFADFLASLTRRHLRLGFLVHERPLPRRTVYDYLRETDPYAIEVTVLTIADRLATQGGRTRPEAVHAHLELAREMLADALAWRRDGPPRAPLRGDELAVELGIAPSPELGRLLNEIEAGVFAGDVEGREDAVALARALLRAT